jgi:hypothetical protein
MGQGRATETERMPKLVGGNTELGGDKLKSRNGFLKPNFERLPNGPRKLIAEFCSIIFHRPVCTWK